MMQKQQTAPLLRHADNSNTARDMYFGSMKNDRKY